MSICIVTIAGVRQPLDRFSQVHSFSVNALPKLYEVHSDASLSLTRELCRLTL